ncbi:hypothetical protein B0H12DRAFT_625578 [Mycena haematopus]|nr:hypothetical protein B0H12DRAFT_625578 [Mycena haematopus]
MAATAFDLTQVGELFDDAVAAIRDGTPEMDALEPQARKWLKAARYKLMRELERIYHELERTRNTPLSQPPWIIDPAQPLMLFTDAVPAVLEPYRSVMGDNLNRLLKDCGFQSTVSPSPTMLQIWLYITFPSQVATAAAPRVPSTLDVDDEFSAQINPDALAENHFVRLIAQARASASGGNDSGGNIGHFRAFEKKWQKVERTLESVPDTGNVSVQFVDPAGKQPMGDVANSGAQTAAAVSTAAQGLKFMGPGQPLQKKKPSQEVKGGLGIFWILGIMISQIVIAFVVVVWVEVELEKHRKYY